MSFSTKDIANYYDQTLDHYQIWWKLKKSLAVHYGYWEADTKSFEEALQNTNKKMAELVNIQSNQTVLDAGCGVGGASFYLANTYNCHVHGITLSEKQLKIALNFRKGFPQEKLVNFSLQDFSKLNSQVILFDIIWGCESTCYSYPKLDFINEAKRLLKPGGKIVIADYFQTAVGKFDTENYMKNWGELWAIEEFHSDDNFTNVLSENGFEILKNINVSQNIFKSSKRMYYSYLLGMIPSKLYNLLHNTSRFGKNHYQSGYFQFKALQEKLWEYRILVAQLK